MTSEQPTVGSREQDPSGGGSRPTTPRASRRLDAFQRRHPWIGFPIAVLYKALDDRAPYLAALVTYYAFVSLFPLLLLFVSIMGFVLQSHPALRQQVINSAVGDVPAIGGELRQSITGFKGSGAGVAIGFLGVVYGGLGAMQSAQSAFNTIYAVPRNLQPNPLRSRLRSLRLLLLLGSTIILSSVVNFLVSNSNGLSAHIDTRLRVLGYVVIFLINVAMFSAAFRLLTATRLTWRSVSAGGLTTGAGWELLQIFGSRYVVHEVNHGTAFYGVFGVVLAAIAWIYLVALVVMLSAELNVVRERRLWPRSLLAPFTDDMVPTPADLACYRSYAETPRFKGWQDVRVTFDPPDDDPVAARDPHPARGGPAVPPRPPAAPGPTGPTGDSLGSAAEMGVPPPV